MGVLQVISDFITRWEEGYVYTAIKTYMNGAWRQKYLHYWRSQLNRPIISA